MNSRTKGKVGEREFAALLREHGFDARRGQQFSGSAESPDVVSAALDWLHIEVKRVQNLNLAAACAQAKRDQSKPGLNGRKKEAWIVAHRRNRQPWMVTLDAERFYRFLRRDLTGDWAMQMAAGSTPMAACAEFSWLRCAELPARTQIHDAMRLAQIGHLTQGPRVAVVASKGRDGGWLVTVTAETLFNFLRGTLPLKDKPTEQTKQQK